MIESAPCPEHEEFERTCLDCQRYRHQRHKVILEALDLIDDILPVHERVLI